jgi:hypothetical protein
VSSLRVGWILSMPGTTTADRICRAGDTAGPAGSIGLRCLPSWGLSMQRARYAGGVRNDERVSRTSSGGFGTRPTFVGICERHGRRSGSLVAGATCLCSVPTRTFQLVESAAGHMVHHAVPAVSPDTLSSRQPVTWAFVRRQGSNPEPADQRSLALRITSTTLDIMLVRS